MIIQYIHKYTGGGEAKVYAERDLISTHREFCLCWQDCQSFKPGEPDNCPIANKLFALCVEHSLTTPVFECPVYKAPEDSDA